MVLSPHERFMQEYQQRLFYKLTALEVNGETTFITQREFNELKRLYEEESDGRRSIRVCTDCPWRCEAYIVK